MSEFTSSILFWVRGWQHILSRRPLMTIAIFPFFLVFLAAIGLGVLLWVYVPSWVYAVMMGLGFSEGFWYQLLYYLALISIALVSVIGSVYIVYVLQQLLAIPFYSLLAERTLIGVGKKADTKMAFRIWAAHNFRMLRISLIKLLVVLPAALLFLVFSFVPLLNLFAVVGVLLILSSDAMDYSHEAMGWGFRQRMEYYKRHWKQWFGMAAGLALTLPLPGLTLLAIPGAVVGAALIVKNEKIT